MSEDRQLTLRDIADRLGVSTATVSNAFGRPDQLSTQLRERILGECERLGYSGPNAAARSLRTGRTHAVGVMLSNYLPYTFSDAVASQFLQGVAEVLEATGDSILIIPSRDHVELAGRGDALVDGCIVYGPPQARHLDRLLRRGKPVIAVDFAHPGMASVNIDNTGAAHDCAAFALQRNSGPVAVMALRLMPVNRICVADPERLFDSQSTITTQRLEGYRAAAAEAGADIDFSRVMHVPDNTHELGYAAARQLLSREPRPRLVLCMSDRLALATMHAARDMGLSVPGDLQVTGFDDIPEGERHAPALTTVHQPSIDKGRIAAEMLKGLRARDDIVLPTRLMVRESCA